MDKIKCFLKNEVVLTVSFLFAVASMFFVKPNKEYVGYIDFKTLALLFCLMAVTAAFKTAGVFDRLASLLLKKANTSRKLYLILTMLCFFLSTLITNDVALITIVPFSLIVLKYCSQTKKMIFFVCAETVAANLGSMITPIGNPQNLYLYSTFDMTMGDFLKPIFPYWCLSLVLIVVMSVFAGSEKLEYTADDSEKLDGKYIAAYAVLFLITLLCVFKLIPHILAFAVCLVFMLIFDRKNILKVDYSLLLTFVFLFVFIGNLGNIERIASFLKSVVEGNEVIAAVLSSQIFSNVPACILLSKFSNNAQALLVGVNLGGLGTLIASMASLISYKFIKKENVKTLSYLKIFTIMNVVFLAASLLLYICIK